MKEPVSIAQTLVGLIDLDRGHSAPLTRQLYEGN